MSSAQTAAAQPAQRAQPLLAAALLLGFGAVVGLRLVVGGRSVAQSATAGLVFAACLLVLATAARPRVAFSWRAVGIGLAGGAFLCVPAAVMRLHGSGARPAGSYLSWAIIVSAVALAEELFLRGVLFDAIASWRGPTLAIIVTSLLFALLHVPLYGWHALPLDFAVGLWLGALRLASGSWLAPGIAHTLADLAGWFLR